MPERRDTRFVAQKRKSQRPQTHKFLIPTRSEPEILEHKAESTLSGEARHPMNQDINPFAPPKTKRRATRRRRGGITRKQAKLLIAQVNDEIFNGGLTQDRERKETLEKTGLVR